MHLSSAGLHSTNLPKNTLSTPLIHFNSLEEPVHTNLLPYPFDKNATLATCTTTVSSTDIPITIAAATPNTVTSNLSITQSGSITDVNIRNLDISHTYISDLEITLEGPDGTRINVLDNICGGQDNINLSLDDEASNSSFPCPPVDGDDYQPSFNLSGFDGLEMNGTWILEINDLYSADGGSLNTWELEIEYTCGTAELCDDGIDNDGDGDIDCDDSDCDGNPLCPVNECTESASSTDVPLTISPTTGATIYSDLVINPSGDITDINVTNLDITHTYIDDVIVILESPEGTRVTILDQPCGGQDDIDIEIDDEASTNNYPCPPTNGNTYIGDNLLSAFDGENMQGTWILEIQDVYPTLDGGSLNSWGLEITYECTPVEICDDGIDNDGNGLIDCADPACNVEAICTPDCETGTILVETFTGISGNSITNLTSSANYPNAPSTTEYATDLNRPNNFADNYGTRIRGYLIPSETGTFVFNLTSDDHSELHLSTDINPANTNMIASIVGWTSEGDHTKFTSQTSTNITLQAGTYYYIEVLHKEGGGGDNLEVYWQTPSNASWTIIPSTNISAYICEELCDDGIDNDGDGDVDCDDDYCGRPTITSISPEDPSNCPSLNNATIAIVGSGSNLEYSINGGISYQSNSSFSGLSSGNYTIRIRNSATNCFIENAVDITLTDPICIEICDDNIDNDGDGDIDCDDADCGMPTITSVSSSNPDNCPSLNNGTITIVGIGSNLEYSIDGGITYQSNNSFSGLSDGNYTIRIRNSVTECFIEHAITETLSDPACVEICDDNIDNDGDGDIDCDDVDCGMPSINSITPNNPSNCPNLDNGSITINGSGSNLEYSINGGIAFQNSNIFNGLSDGNYNIRIRNSVTGCYVDHPTNIALTDPTCSEICDDNIDNDGDGDIDCDDSDCEFNITTSPNNEICLGENTTLTVSGADNYFWSTGATTSSITVSPTTTTTYNVQGYNSSSYYDNIIQSEGFQNDSFNLINTNNTYAPPSSLFNDLDETGAATFHAVRQNNLLEWGISYQLSGNYQIDEISIDRRNDCCTERGEGGIMQIYNHGVLVYESNLVDGTGNGILAASPAPNVIGDMVRYIFLAGTNNNQGNGTLNFTEWIIGGTRMCSTESNITVTVNSCVEICDDNIDNDDDSDIDCADLDCSPEILGISYSHADNCPNLNDGSINISANGNDMEYSIDNGTSFQSSNIFSGLSQGQYNVIVRNSVTGCEVIFTSNPINISSPICVEICANNIDDDGDGLVDCNDTDCQPLVSILADNTTICPGEEIILTSDVCENYQSLSTQRPLINEGWHNAYDSGGSGIIGDGILCFTLSDYNLSSLQTFGLNTDPNTDDNYTGIDFGINVAIRPDLNKFTLQIRENGSIANVPYDSSNSILGQSICIRRTGTSIEYLLEGSIIYTSSQTSTGTLYYDHSLHSSTSSSIYINGYSYFTNISLCGTIDLDYLWNDSSTLDTLVATSAGAYALTITDNNGCTASSNINIDEGDCPEICDDNIDNDGDGDIDCDDADCGQPTFSSVTLANPSNCPTLDNGSITIVANGSNLEYSIDNGVSYQTSGNYTNLLPGTYNIILRNSITGCNEVYAANPISIVQISCPEICDDGIDNDLDGDIDCDDSDCGTPVITSVNTQNIDDCINLNDGQIAIATDNSANNGASMEFSIDNGVTWSPTSIFSNLSTGTYNVRVRFVGIECYLNYANNPIQIIADNCPEICNDLVDNDGDGLIDCDDLECIPVIDSVNIKNADNCPALNNGFIHINTPNNSIFEYSIDGGIFYQLDPNFNGLASGNYNVRIRRIGTDCFTDHVNNPIVIINENCVEACNDGIDNDGDGLIDCYDPDCFSGTIDDIISTSPNNCPLLDNGIITIETRGDNLVYSIDDGLTFSASNTFSSLMNGNYDIVIRDTISGCELEYAANPFMLLDIPCPEICDDGIDNDGDGLIDCEDGGCGTPSISSIPTTDPTNCPDLDNGTITVKALGLNLEYSVDNGVTFYSNNIFTGLQSGSYTVVVRNGVTGCEITFAVEIVLTGPVCLEICGDGIDNDGDGDMDCDDSDCETPNIIQVISNDPDNCPDLNNGFINIFGSGENKEFSINGGITYQVSNQFNNLSEGSYDIRVRNTESGCYVDYVFNTLTLNDPVCIEICGDGIDNDGDGNTDCDDPDCDAPTFADVTTTMVDNCPSLDNGSITISAAGNNLQYSINGGITFQTSNSFTGLVSGNYNVVIKNGITDCEVNYAFNPLLVDEIVCPEICDDGIDNDGDGLIDCADPDCNPATIDDVIHSAPDNCPILNNGSITIIATGNDLEYSITNGIIYQDSPTFTGLYNGAFHIKIRNKVTGCVLAYENNPLVILDPDCGEICDDGIDNDGDGLIDCADGDCATPLSVGEDHTDPDNCYELNNGNILMDAVGANIEWSIDGGVTFQGDPSFDNLIAGTYYLVARNFETGCEAIGPTVTLFNSACNEICDDGIDNDGDGLIDCADGNCGAPTIGLVSAFDPYNCPILDNGSLTVTGSGNNLEYSIDGGATYQSSNIFTGLVPGNYTVQLINTSTGCTTPYPNNPVVLLDPICGEICDDGIDNDGDGDIDCEDSECVNASNTYMIDFDLDTPVITKYSDQVATVEGNVLFASDASDAGFNYIVSIVIDGGPGGGSAVNFPPGSVLNDAEFNTDDPSIVYNGAQTVIDLDLQGRENINGSINYYRDNTSNMLVTMYLDNGQAFSDIQYTIVDIDMDLTGSGGDYAGAYIDNVQILSGAGSNTITPYNSDFVKVIGDVARANFTDNNNNNLPDQHEFIQAQTFNPAGNITVNTAGTISKVQFIYSDYNAAIEGTGATFHEFNSGNQRIGLGKHMTFESGCQVIEICYDNIDNDGDGLVDCEDNDCDPVITFLGATNTDNCPLLDNGTITIQAIGADLEYSVDGGITYQTSNEFTGLSGGSYEVWVQNSISGCNVDYAFNPVIIEDPICIEICDDGIDNDGNGLIDCEDPACDAGEISNVILIDPTNCPENDNGTITIISSGDNIEYSIDGGASYQASNVFTDLVARNYTIVIRDNNSGCLSGYPTNPVSLSPTNCDCIGVDNAFRANFENTSGDNIWTFNNGASDGNFVIGTPNPYTMSSTLMEIVPYRGTKDLLTGVGYQQDLDGGESVARSRNITLSDYVTDISFDLQYYFSHLDNSSNADYLRIEIMDASNNNVLTTIVSENGTSSYRNAVWTGAAADLTSYAGNEIYIRVRSIDGGGGSKLEVAVDDIEIIETPDVSLTLPFENFCSQNASFVLTGGLPLGGVYSGPGIIDGATFNADIAGTGSHTITYTYTSNDGCEIISTDVVVVGEVTITSNTSPLSICSGDSALIEAPTVTGESPFTYVWDNSLGSGTSHTVSPIENTQYNVTVTDNFGCTASTFVNVIVNLPPTTSLQVDGSNCFEDGITQLNLLISGGIPDYSFEYSGPNGFISTEQNPIVPSAGIYNVTVTDGNGCTATDSVEVLDPFLPEIEGDESVCFGSGTILTATPTGLNYQWGVFAGGATTEQISVTPLSTTTYTVTVTNNVGCTSTTDFTVTVNDTPDISISADINATCSGSEANITVTVNNYDENLNYSYQWSHGAGIQNITVNPIISTTYIVTVIDNNLCFAIDSIEVDVNDAEIENVTLGSNVACDGECTGEMLVDVNYPVTGPFTIFYDYAGVTYSSGPYDFGTEVDTAIVIGELCAGSYSNITIQSTNTGCTDTWTGDDVIISESHADWEHVTLTSILSNCSGVCDGSFTVDANLGVTGEFEISYSYNGNIITEGPFNFAGDILIDGLCEGTYSDITITSIETGCQDIWPTDIEITTPDPEANVVVLVDDDCQINEGSVTINVSGGILPYTINWQSEDGSESGSQVFNFHGNHSIYGLIGGTTYCIEVEDDNGCSTGD